MTKRDAVVHTPTHLPGRRHADMHEVMWAAFLEEKCKCVLEARQDFNMANNLRQHSFLEPWLLHTTWHAEHSKHVLLVLDHWYWRDANR